MSSVEPVTVSVSLRTHPERAWTMFTDPTSVTEWNFALPSWHCPQARSELREGGRFCYRMEARDGSFGFDFEGTFLEVCPPMRLRYSLGAEREVLVQFVHQGERTLVMQTFTPDAMHSVDQQRVGWQSILDNYQRFVEAAAGNA
jgi:uncharacterized protein YndB with AHSA1/START domain